jgi:hypothetical protein
VGAKRHPALGHFVQADTIVPNAGNSLDYHRYAYTRFNPLKYTDPTGHQASCMTDQAGQWTCNPNATTGGHTLTIDLQDEPPPCPNNDCSGKDLALLLGGMLTGSMAIAAAPPVFLALGSAACRDGDCTNEVTRTASTAQRAQNLLNGQAGYNVSPEEWFSKYPTIGRQATFVTDKKAIADALGSFEGKGSIISVTLEQATKLENALGLQNGSLANGFRISRITGVVSRGPASPIGGNEFFLGPGKGLPGGGPELTIAPISTQGGTGITQIIVKVVESLQ